MASPLAAEAGLVVEILNQSAHTFRLDGEMLSKGAWRSDEGAVILPGEVTRVDLAASQFSGVRGLLWWVSDDDRDVYVSMVFYVPKLTAGIAPPRFACFAGHAPMNLKDELETAPALIRYMEEDVNGCGWVATLVGVATEVRLTIFEHVDAPLKKMEPLTPVTATPMSEPSSRRVLLGRHRIHSEDSRFDSKAETPLQKLRAQTRPKDLQDGLARGAKVATAGLAAGIVAPVAGSVRGAKEGGALGLMKGLGLGLLGGAAAVAGGAVAGVVQVGRGLKNTPRAHAGRANQKVWDQELGHWVDIDLAQLEADLLADSSENEDLGPFGKSCSSGGRPVADPTFYEMLGVPTDAAPATIKRAYYRQARECHPDKHPEDADATEKFQNLAMAYKVLSDPDARNNYDALGMQGLEAPNLQMDPALFFGLLFGCERFLPYTGELHLAMEIDHVAQSLRRAREDFCDVDEPEPKTLRDRQHRREVRCAIFLRDFLNRMVLDRNGVAFLHEARGEAAELARARFGPELLLELGEMYRIRADVYLANELSGRQSLAKRAAAARRSGHSAKTCMSLTRSTVGGLRHAMRVNDALRREEMLAEARRPQDRRRAVGSAPSLEDALEDALPTFLHAAWAAVVHDLDKTIKNVGRKLLQDKSVPWQIRIRRAQALKVLGQTFEEEGKRAVAAGAAGFEGLSSEAAKETLIEAVVGSMRSEAR